MDNQNLPWKWKQVSNNPNLTINDILNNPSKPWSYVYIAYNKFGF